MLVRPCVRSFVRASRYIQKTAHQVLMIFCTKVHLDESKKCSKRIFEKKTFVFEIFAKNGSRTLKCDFSVICSRYIFLKFYKCYKCDFWTVGSSSGLKKHKNSGGRSQSFKNKTQYDWFPGKSQNSKKFHTKNQEDSQLCLDVIGKKLSKQSILEKNGQIFV